MTEPFSPDGTGQKRSNTPSGKRIILTEVLFEGSREVILQHGTETYRLQVTGSNKLILTK